MLLRDYIRANGDDTAAHKLEVNPRSIRSWREGKSAPHAKKAKDIARLLSGVPVTFEDCFDESAECMQ